ncbi:MAG: hypothetical protein GX620_01485 [Chloroflexi bacterium]|nr:hypothetical protein [Chloroflexota bacterium]
MTIEAWLPALMAYLMPVGVFLMAWGGMRPERAHRAASVGVLALSLSIVGYFAVGFAFHLGGAAVVSNAPGLQGLTALWARQGMEEWGLIGLQGFFLTQGAATPEAMGLFVTYVPLVATAVLLVILSISDRARGWQMTALGVLVGALAFPVVACWAWGGGWLANLGSTLDLGHGFVDLAGAGVVYLLGGTVALGALVGLGARLPVGSQDEPETMPPTHFPLLASLGAWLLLLGWLGWILSLPFHVGDALLNRSLIAVNGLLAAAGAAIASQFYCWVTVGRADPLMAARGVVAGIVVLSAGAPFVRPWTALVAGLFAGALLPIGVYTVERLLRLPDDTSTVALGVAGGSVGLVLVAVLADGRWGQGWNGVGVEEYLTVAGQGVTGFAVASGFHPGGQGQMLAQLLGLGAIAVPGFLLGWLSLLLFTLPYRIRQARLDRLEQESLSVELGTSDISVRPSMLQRMLQRVRRRGEVETTEEAPDAEAEALGVSEVAPDVDPDVTLLEMPAPVELDDSPIGDLPQPVDTPDVVEAEEVLDD